MEIEKLEKLVFIWFQGQNFRVNVGKKVKRKSQSKPHLFWICMEYTSKVGGACFISIHPPSYWFWHSYTQMHALPFHLPKKRQSISCVWVQMSLSLLFSNRILNFWIPALTLHLISCQDKTLRIFCLSMCVRVRVHVRVCACVHLQISACDSFILHYF